MTIDHSVVLAHFALLWTMDHSVVMAIDLDSFLSLLATDHSVIMAIAFGGRDNSVVLA
jgi:hypothetical protein